MKDNNEKPRFGPANIIPTDEQRRTIFPINVSDDTTANNILIAEFMGVYPREDNDKTWFSGKDLGDAGLPFKRGRMGNGRGDLSFHSSWDWLMPVVEKIEEFGFDFTASKRRDILVYDANFMDHNNIDVVYVEDCRNRIDATYKAVVEFIKWYTNKKEIEDNIASDFDREPDF